MKRKIIFIFILTILLTISMTSLVFADTLPQIENAAKALEDTKSVVWTGLEAGGLIAIAIMAVIAMVNKEKVWTKIQYYVAGLATILIIDVLVHGVQNILR